MATEILESPMMASLLEDDFPDEIYLIAMDRDDRKHMAVRAENVPGFELVHGLGCAITPEEALQMAKRYGFPGKAICYSFEEARELTKTKPDPICGLLLEDVEGNCIAFHFVK